ncbi:MAG: GNAT family N-acetyltransferase [Candidatus Buchananbacteria bacterium]
MAIKELTKDREQAWEDFLTAQEQANFSHSIGMRKIIRDNYGLADHYLINIDNRDSITGILPLFKTGKKNFISLPFTDWAGFVGAESAKKEFNDYLINRSLNQGEKYELRQSRETGLGQASPNIDNICSLIDLGVTADDLWKRIDKKARNQVRKAEKYNPEYLKQKELLPDFYLLYLKSMKRHGTPAHKIGFFADILKQFDGAICAVKYNDKIAAAALTFVYKNTLHIPWAASDRKLKSFNFNDYLYWRIMAESCRPEIKKIDLGRSQIGSPVAKFKSQWNCRNITLPYYLISSDQKTIKTPQKSCLRYASKIYRLLPLNITALIGPKLRKYLP